MNKFLYRPEIDGLRSLAVFSVIIYHAKISTADLNFFSGGFFGVDIFFVISGYLITSIILTNIQIGNFSFINFYERRIRRILPALFFIMVCTIPFAWKYLLPHQFKDYAYSIVASTFFSSNFYFWIIGEKYASESALLKPLLHTWSLAVEEQYYIFFPVFLYIAVKYLKKYLLTIFIISLIGSLLIAEFLSRNNSSLNFYILPTRAWELLAGSILVKLEMDFGRKNKFPFKNLMPSFGIFLIFFSFLYFDEDILHPSVITIIPVLGTVLLVWFCQKGELITNILSNKILVGLGLISYSLYLWHYPIFAFGRIDNFIIDSNLNKIILIIATLILSIISYFLIEKPFRNKKLTSVKSLSIFLTILTFILLIMSYIVIKNQGFVERAPQILKNQYTNNLQKIIKQNEKDCFDRLDNFCIFNKDSKKSIIVVGDSSVEVLEKPLFDFSKKNNIKLTLLTNGGCPYYPDFNRVINKTNQIEEKCNADLQNKRREIMLSDPKAIIIIGGRFPLHLSEKLFDNEEGGVESEKWDRRFEPVNKKNLSKTYRKKLLMKNFIDGVNELLKNGNKVILLYPIPLAGWNVPSKLMNSLPSDDSKIEEYLLNNPITTSYDVYLKRTEDSRRMLKKIKHKNLYNIYPDKLFCNNIIPKRCVTHNLKNVFYRDESHLSYEGSKMLMKIIKEKIKF